MMTPELEELDIEDAPSPNDTDLKRVAVLADRLASAEVEVGRLTQALRAALDVYRDIAERQLPEQMAACGLSSYSLTSGVNVTVKSRFVCGQLTDEAGLTWVEENGGAALIKASLLVDLPASDLTVARQLFDIVQSHPAASRFTKIELRRAVHQSTLASFVTELVDNNYKPPLADLGVIRRTIARLGGRKLKPIELKTFEIQQQGR